MSRHTSRPRQLPGRRWWVVLVAAATALVATGCAPDIVGDDGRRPVVVVVSDTWVANQQGTTAGGASGGSQVQTRIRGLQDAVTALRRETGTGWVGTQDDVTGYLTTLSGGSWPGEPAAFMDAYGAPLFGLDSSALVLDEPDAETVPGTVSQRATQAVDDVPVLDGSLSFTSRAGRLTEVRGRVFPGLRVDTAPTITAEAAAATAAQQAGGTSTGTPALVVLPRDAGILAWEVVVTGATSGPGSQGSTIQRAGRYYVDAASGQVVDVRPVSADLAAPLPGVASYKASLPKGSPLRETRRTAVTGAPAKALRAPDQRSVEIDGEDPIGAPLTGFGLQTDRGIDLVDTTTPAYDAQTKKGVVRTYDASAVSNDNQLPGQLVRTLTPTVTDPDALAAHVYSRDIAEYYQSLGRDSWDGKGGDLVNSVNYGPADYCNAFFTDYTPDPQMVYGDSCVVDGEAYAGSLVVPDVAGHEITHGVTNTSARLLYTGQSGALNESFSDYFGNVIGDLIRGQDTDSIGEDACVPITGTTPFCNPNPDGSRSLRYMLNGNDFDEYLRILNPGVRLTALLNYSQDNGGVHINSAIWNNALWEIRSRLAQIDGQPGTDSPLAQDFDRAVFGALTTRLTSTAGFVDARTAVEQVIRDSGLDPTVARVAREVFDAEKICAGCPTTTTLAGDSVSTAAQTQLHPVVSGDRAAWLDLSGQSEYEGYAASTVIGSGGAPRLGADGDAVDVAFAGDALLALQFDGDVVRIAPDGSTETLDNTGDYFPTQVVGLGSSDQGGAWYDNGDDVVRYVDADGQQFQAEVPGRAGDTVIALAAGGGSVTVGTDQGKVFVWTPGAGEFRNVGQVGGAVISLATYGGNVFVIDDALTSTLFTADGQTVEVTQQAFPFGAAMSADYVVWPEAVGGAEAGVSGGDSGYPETDLFLLSLNTGKIYNLLEAPAQQGFPSISGDQLVWQDAALGGDDVFAATVPDGL